MAGNFFCFFLVFKKLIHLLSGKVLNNRKIIFLAAQKCPLALHVRKYELVPELRQSIIYMCYSECFHSKTIISKSKQLAGYH